MKEFHGNCEDRRIS